jgi:hypothetical protein
VQGPARGQHAGIRLEDPGDRLHFLIGDKYSFFVMLKGHRLTVAAPIGRSIFADRRAAAGQQQQH